LDFDGLVDTDEDEADEDAALDDELDAEPKESRCCLMTGRVFISGEARSSRSESTSENK
jgi:hypothetical protein